MRALITGGAGCIGSDLAERLLGDGNNVTVFDNLSSGKMDHVSGLLSNTRFRFVKGDLLKKKQIEDACKGADIVFHLAANSDIKYSTGDPTDEDLRLNTLATYNVLEAMRLQQIKKIVFTSSSAVYGEAKKIPTPEDYPLQPISLYAASKAACESIISGFCHMFGMQGWILRLSNVISGKSRKKGETVLTDFINKLRQNHKELVILGNGKQSKSYLLAEDCVGGIITVLNKSDDAVNIYNLGAEDSATVNEIASVVVDEMKLKDVRFVYSGGDRGWLGDVPKFLLDINKAKKTGWKPRYKSKEAIRIATRSLLGK